MKRLLSILFVLQVMLLSPSIKSQESIVHAVLFYSPTCPHCHDVIRQHLPPLQSQHGKQLVIIGINVRSPDGQKMFLATMDKFAVADDQRGVPALVIGDQLLQGSDEIPARLPALIDSGLAGGGLDWPDLPGLDTVVLAQSQAQAGIASSNKPTFKTKLSVAEKFARDPAGNSLATLVLVAMLISLGLLARNYFSAASKGVARLSPWPSWVIPALLPIGLGVAAYLSFVEVNQVKAICGPVGDCNAVQASPYAFIFGIPMAVLGLLAYISIGLSWALQRLGSPPVQKLATTATLWLTLIGTGFSIYLTFLEPFVIGATCLWCLTSAVVMTLMLWAAATQRGLKQT